MKHLIALAALLPLAAPVAAQTGTGSITGTLDLDDAAWVVAGEGEGPTSQWEETDTGTRITLVGTPEAGSDDDAGTLTMIVDVSAGSVEARVEDARIELQRDGETLVAVDENLDLTFTAFEETGSDLAVTGSFAATLTPDPTESIVVSPGEEAATIDGNFQATVTRAEADL